MALKTLGTPNLIRIYDHSNKHVKATRPVLHLFPYNRETWRAFLEKEEDIGSFMPFVDVLAKGSRSYDIVTVPFVRERWRFLFLIQIHFLRPIPPSLYRRGHSSSGQPEFADLATDLFTIFTWTPSQK
jgi:hypothetical protein